MRSPSMIIFTSSGIGSGSSDTVLTRLSASPSDLMRISPDFRARFSASRLTEGLGCVVNTGLYAFGLEGGLDGAGESYDNLWGRAALETLL